MSSEIQPWCAHHSFPDGGVVYTITPSRDGAGEPERAETLMGTLFPFAPLGFRVFADYQRIIWQIFDLTGQKPPDLLPRVVHSIYPKALVEVSPYTPPVLVRPVYRNILFFRHAGDPVAAQKTVTEVSKLDPLAVLVQSMSGLQPGEQISHWHFHYSEASLDWLQEAYRRITRSQISLLDFLYRQGQTHAIATLLAGNPRAPRYVERDQRKLEAKLAGPLMAGNVLIQVDVLDPSRLSLMAPLIAAMPGFASEINGLVLAREQLTSSWAVTRPGDEQATSVPGLLRANIEKRDRRLLDTLLVLSSAEAALLWHFLDPESSSPKIVWRSGSQVDLPASLAGNAQGIRLGNGLFEGKEVPVFIREEDRLAHAEIHGGTGGGKTNLAQSMAAADIANGAGVAVIDPKGDFVRMLLAYGIPDGRIDDVRLYELSNETYPMPANPFRFSQGLDQLAIGQFVALVNKIYPGMDTQAPRALEGTIAALNTLKPVSNPTLRDLSKVLTDRKFREQLLARGDSVAAQEFFDVFDAQSPSMQREITTPILQRARRMYEIEAIYPILCHPDGVDFTEVINEGQILLVSLAADERRIPESERRLIGALLVSQLQMAAMASRKQKPPFYLYVDEAQHLVTTALDRALDEARSFGMYLILLHQYLGQLRGNLLESVLGNVGATIVFRPGLSDAKLLEPIFQPEFSTRDLLNLPAYTAAVKMRLEGQPIPAFTLHTLPPPGDPESEGAVARAALIRRRSIERYTPKKREEVLAWLEARYPRRNRPFRDEEGGQPDDEDWIVP